MDGADLIDLQTLRIVRAMLEHGSITAAASSLGFSQPAVSQHLRRAESRLEVALIERAGRAVRLTEAGRVLAQHAAAVMAEIDAAAQSLDGLRGTQGGRVRLVGFPSASPSLVPALLAELRAQAPGLTVTYVEAEPPAAVDAVRDGRADLALSFSYPGDIDDPHGASAHGLRVTEIGADDLQLVLPIGHPLADGRRVDVATLAGERWIAGCPRCRGHLMQLCGRAGFVPDIAFETDNVAAVQGLVAQGIGVATLPALALASYPRRDGIVTAPLPATERRAVHAVTAHGAERVPSVRIVQSLLARLVAQIAPLGASAGA